jgi:hypothetical protein
VSSSSDRGLPESRPCASGAAGTVSRSTPRDGGRAQAAAAEHCGDGRGRDVDAELKKLPPDPEVAPARVLPPQAKDQVLDGGIERGTAGPARGALAPAHELPVPSGERVRAHQEAPQSIAGEQTSCWGQKCSVGGGEAGSRSSPAEDLQLAAEDGRLEIPLLHAAADEQAEKAREEPIQQGHEHRAKSDLRGDLPANGQVRDPIEFLYPSRTDQAS